MNLRIVSILRIRAEPSFLIRKVKLADPLIQLHVVDLKECMVDDGFSFLRGERSAVEESLMEFVFENVVDCGLD